MSATADSIVDSVEKLLAWMGTGLKQSLADYCDIESVDDEQTITFKDGSLVTIISLLGSYRMIGRDEFSETDEKIFKSLKAYLANGGHSVHAYFSMDPDSAQRDISHALSPSLATAKRLGMDLDDLFDEEVRHLSKFCASEKVFITLITRPSAVTKAEQKSDIKAKQELLLANALPKLTDVPNVFAAMSSLRTRHTSFVSAILGDFKDAKLRAEVMDVHRAGYEQRLSVDPEFTDESWRPVLPGDKIPTRFTKRDKRDMSGYFWPKLSKQICPRNARPLDLKTVEVGNRIYAPMFIDYQPSDIKPFSMLFNRVSENRMPWRITFLIESGGIGMLAFKGFITALFGWSNSDNKLIKESINELKNLVKNHGELDVKLRVDFATWAPKGENKLLATRASQLARAVQGWGGAEVREVSGDAVQGFMSSGLALSTKSVATPSAAALGDVTNMLPLYRPASPWADGAVLFRTPDGKLFPYQPNSPEQSSWINLLYAEPRSGKSVAGNQINLALCLSPGIPRLPLISIIDIGRASSGLISLLYHALPENQRHLVASIRLRMTPEFAINPFDTQLGCREPLPHEKSFLVNFMCLLVTPMGKESPADGMVGLARMAIDEAYKEYSDQNNPKRYEPNQDPEVDQAIQQYGMNPDDRTTWWEVVDFLFINGSPHEASLAQRYAVPLVADIAAISRAPQFVDMYGGKETEDGEPLLQAFSRMLSESLRSYPILGFPTRFDIGGVRVISIDLDEVAKHGSAAADHQTAVCYMLARYVSAKNFYLHEDIVPYFRTEYRSYHERRINDIRQDKKHLQYDEFHRTKKVRPVREQVIGDMREGGKCGVMVSLISQSVTDFDDTMLEFATCKIILSKANEKVARTMQDIFGLTETVEYAIKNLIKQPGPQGSTFVGMFSTKSGDAVHLLNNTIGGIKLWAFSTTNEDTYVRDALYRQLGPKETRKYLAQQFPGGSVANEIERRKKAMEDSGIIGDGGHDGVIDIFIDELVATYHKQSERAVA